jgi:asparagine synthase (glutamine-hydrolysing)
MWSFVLYDKSKNKIFCSRDRYGIKPFNYVKLNDNFLIGSEIKQFTIFNEFHPKLNVQNAIFFLAESQLNTNDDTFFQGVKVLPAGHNLVYNLSTHTYVLNQYYNQGLINKNNSITYKDATTEYLRLFKKAVSIRLRSDVEIGSCLSGGIDSSSIISIAKGISSDMTSRSTSMKLQNIPDIILLKYFLI